MALYALIDPNSRVCQLSAAIFPVAAPMVWTSDVSAIAPSPQYGWAATEAGGTWSFTAPAEPVQTLTGETAEQALESVQPRYPVVMIPTVAASAEAWVAMVRGGSVAS
ncbi:MAG TPA: hypothetical protein VNC39_12755 [Acidocella sp.]|jgi:hypothetical protein|uniref:hypothetical protein n=1 Tax=Acidocella sp. TaxID=50710 RepID=UPI002C2E910C|nr:hypothetical protein [Acidocella sp.]HVE22837.1 hypothetical protein [Acidocella sp.]